MIVTIDNAQIARMKAAIENTGKQLRKELAVAVNATAAKSKSIIAKQIGKELAVAQKDIKTTISQSRRAGELDISATVEVKKEKRLGLNKFGARQTKKGVSYKVSKSRGRSFIEGAFQGPKPGLMKASWRGNVFKRAGKSRLPIVKLKGPSTWGVFVVGKKIGPSAAETEAELKKQVDRRIRFLLLKQAGTI